MKVFKGVNDGCNFAPKQTITRAEVAAIIYRIVTGDVNDVLRRAFTRTTPSSRTWRRTTGPLATSATAPTLELIVGDGTNFYPDQTVNGYQALAMILRAMGYDAERRVQGLRLGDPRGLHRPAAAACW